MEDARATVAVQKLVEIASHDLRNPLSVIMVNAAVLSRAEPLDDSRRIKAASRILSNVGRMNRMIGDLLDFAYERIGAAVRTKPTDLDLGELAAKAVDEARASTPSRTFELEQSGDLRGRWDLDRMLRGLQTMIASALRFGNPDDTVHVSVLAAGIEVELRVVVSANPAIVEHVQHLLASLHAGAEIERDGYWIAVAVLRQTVEAHGGTLFASASATEGIRFVVRLPRQSESGEKAAVR